MTQIKCPFCNTSYDIEDKLINQTTKKFRCAKCKNVFEFSRDEDNKDNIIIKPVEPNKEEKPDENEFNTKEVFARLDQSLEKYKITAKDPSATPTFIQSIGWTNKKNKISYSLAIFFVSILMLNYYKFEITRLIPQAQIAYAALGIKSTVNGEGLTFSNISKEDYEKDGINYMRVKGYLINNTKKNIKVPKIHVTLLSPTGGSLYEDKVDQPLKTVTANDRTSFDIEIKKPSPLAKYVYLTFVED